MEIVVLACGVADPKWPLPPDLTLATLQAHATRYAALSPFDEAAIEIALSLRDTDPEVRITALVASDEPLVRSIAGWRPDTIHRVDLGAVPRWDAGAVAQALAAALGSLAPQADLVLVGREFGDFDDGAVPAATAHHAGLPYLPLVLRIEQVAGGWSALAQGSGGLERVRFTGRAMLSATNDPGNRLRHPLMKNVMLAKKAVFAPWKAPAPQATGDLHCEDLDAVAPPERNTACEWLQGTPAEKAHALARALTTAAGA